MQEARALTQGDFGDALELAHPLVKGGGRCIALLRRLQGSGFGRLLRVVGAHQHVEQGARRLNGALREAVLGQFAQTRGSSERGIVTGARGGDEFLQVIGDSTRQAERGAGRAIFEDAAGGIASERSGAIEGRPGAMPCAAAMVAAW